MESLGNALESYMGNKVPQFAHLAKIQQNNQRVREAIQQTWADSPQSVDYILSHINSLYIAPDKKHVKNDAEDQRPMVLGMYVDDPLARSELQARRETFAIWARQKGLSFNSLVIHASYGGMRERFAYPDAKERLKAVLSDDPVANNLNFKPTIEPPLERDQKDLMATFRRAVILSFEDIAQSKAFLDYLEGIYFYPEKTYLTELVTPRRRNKRQAKRKIRVIYYHCYCFVRPCDKALFEALVANYAPTIFSKAALFKLYFDTITVHASPRAIAGRKAYPTNQPPSPLPAFTKQELDELT